MQWRDGSFLSLCLLSPCSTFALSYLLIVSLFLYSQNVFLPLNTVLQLVTQISTNSQKKVRGMSSNSIYSGWMFAVFQPCQWTPPSSPMTLHPSLHCTALSLSQTHGSSPFSRSPTLSSSSLSVSSSSTSDGGSGGLWPRRQQLILTVSPSTWS